MVLCLSPHAFGVAQSHPKGVGTVSDVVKRVAAALRGAALCPTCGVEGRKYGPDVALLQYGNTESLFYECPKCRGPQSYFTADGRVWYGHTVNPTAAGGWHEVGWKAPT